MRFPLFLKCLAVGGLSLLLLIPLGAVMGLVEGRNQRQIETESDIARGSAGAQDLVGPLVVVPYTREERRLETTDGKAAREVWEEVAHQQVIVPRDLRLKARAEVESRRRGLYKAQVYRLGGDLTGTFALDPDQLPKGSRVKLGAPFLVMGLKDPRGIRNRMTLDLAGRTLPFRPGTELSHPASGVHVPLPHLDLTRAQELPFHIPLDLLGTRAFRMAPVAEETRLELEGGWHAPSFEGGFAPLSRTLTPTGFQAQWTVPHLSRNLEALLGEGPDTQTQTFGVAFIDPVNLYLLSERATKYGFLFVLLTFGAFLLREFLRRSPLHPMHYLLVGLSLALFFLLVLSLAERLGFARAYLLATVANLALLGTYLTGALGSRREGLAFTGALGLLYAALYGLLRSEDNALLLGSVLLFALLAAAMIGTRRLDWRGGQDAVPPAPHPAP